MNIRNLVLAIRLALAKKKADRCAAAFGMRYYVIYVGGKIRVCPKRRVKQLLKTGYFRRGTKIPDIEKRALYITG